MFRYLCFSTYWSLIATGSTGNAMRVGNSECDGSTRLPVRSQAVHHSIPDAQERPQAYDDDRDDRPRGRRRPQQVAVEQRLHGDGPRRRRRRSAWNGICRRSGPLVRLRRFTETTRRQSSIWLFRTSL